MKIYSLPLAMLIIFCVSNCTTYKPVQGHISEPDYNQRRAVRNAQLERKINPIGIGLTVGSALGGAYLAYQSKPIKVNSESTDQNVTKAGNVLLGTLTGFGLAAITNYIVHGQGKRKKLKEKKDFDLWLKRYDKNYQFVEGDGRSMIIIDKRIENKFKGKSIKDARHFANVFPSSVQKERVFKETNSAIGRNEIPTLVSLFSGNRFTDVAKVRYYEESKNLNAFKDAMSIYPIVEYNRESKAISLVTRFEEADWVLDKFPYSSKKKKILVNSLAYPYKKGQGYEMERMLSADFYLSAIDFHNKSDHYSKHYMSIIEETKEPDDLNSLYGLYKEYDWLQFPEKRNYYLNAVWDISNRKYTDGDLLLKMISNLPQKQNLGFLRLNSLVINNFLSSKLEEELRQNVYITNGYIKQPQSDGNFDNWKSSYFYDALYLAESGELKFLYTGTIVNNSKFSFPVEVSLSGDLVAEVDVEIFNIKASEVSKFLGGSSQAPTVTMGTETKEFIIPNIKPGQSFPLAVMFDFGKGNLKQGVNIIGAQMYYESTLKNVREQMKLLKKNVSSNQLNRQKYWLSLQDKTLSKTKAKELFGYDYDPDNYIFEWPTLEDYKSSYGSDCGCKIVSDTPLKYGWTGELIHSTILFENGSAQKYSWTSDGKIQIHDGFLGTLRTKVKNYTELTEHLTKLCKSYFCD